MNWRGLTKILIVIAAGLIIAYDIFAFMRGGVDATISRVLLGWSRSSPILPFAVGTLCGHLFWPQPKSPELPGKQV